MGEAKIIRYDAGVLARDLAVDVVGESGDAVRAFERSPAWLRLQQLIEAERMAQINRVITSNPDMTTMPEVNFAQGVNYALGKLYEFMDKILQEASRARNE